MDSVKPILELLKKHLFWIICAVVLLVTVFTFRSVDSSLEEQRVANVNQVETSFKSVQAISQKGDSFPEGTYHPNDKTHEGMLKKTSEAKEELSKAWEMKYNEQQPLLFWDKEIGEVAIQQFEELRPIEKMMEFTPEPNTQEDYRVRPVYRQAYQRLIKNALPKLAESIGDAWQPVLSRPEVTAEEKAKVSETKRVVLWNETNQAYWESRFTKFNNRINPEPYPRVLQVLYAQEDMWILRSILEDIIKKTNGDAKANDLAKVKKIDHIYIGQDAQGIVGEVDIAKSMTESGDTGSEGSNGGMGEEEMMMMMMESSGSMPGGSPGDSASGLPTVRTYGDGTYDPANGRYVDANFEPLGATTLRETFKAVKKELAYLAIAKRIPVRIGLVMDERSIMELLANCANARLPLEVKQVRINAHKPNTTGSLASQFSSGATSLASATGGGGSRGESSEEEMMQYEMQNMESEGGGTKREDESVLIGGEYDTNVEIYGVIYLYNPPDDSVLGEPEEAPATPVEPTATQEPQAIIRKS